MTLFSFLTYNRRLVDIRTSRRGEKVRIMTLLRLFRILGRDSVSASYFSDVSFFDRDGS